MAPVSETVCLAAFVVVITLPGLYGLHLFALMLLAMVRKRGVTERQRETVAQYCRETPDEAWPRVTTQLPIYNEVAVAERLIRAAARLDYPRERLEIQVLDDSSDETRALVDRVCASLRLEGHDIRVVRRPTRAHYKAGALANGLRQARGDYIAIFDADFIPEADFLRRLIPLIASDPQAACVQGRWGHLNVRDAWYTQALALGMDGHFGVEQPARAWNGLLLNFNGTAGVWRRAAIDDPRVGGWSGDTLTEDLDLSYRAQLAGWRILYTQEVVAPAEVPADVDALKSQQRRWATGSIQTARKLLPAVWRSQRLSLLQKLEASIHLTQYSVNVFMLLMALVSRSLLAVVPPERFQETLGWSWWLVLFAALAPSIAYVYARWSLERVLAGPIQILKLITLGLGLSLNNTVAVFAGLVQRGGEFVRTPKSGSAGARAARPPYAALRSRLWSVELVLGGFCLVQWAAYLPLDHYVGGTFLLLYGLGLVSLGWHSRPRTTRAAPDAQAARPAQIAARAGF